MAMPSDRHRLLSILWKKESSLTEVAAVAGLPAPQAPLSLQLVKAATTINLLSRVEIYRTTTTISSRLDRGVEVE